VKSAPNARCDKVVMAASATTITVPVDVLGLAMLRAQKLGLVMFAERHPWLDGVVSFARLSSLLGRADALMADKRRGRFRLVGHPGFDALAGCLRCRICNERHGRVREFEAHVLAHDELTPEVAYCLLSRSRFEKAALARGWVEVCSGGELAVGAVERPGKEGCGADSSRGGRAVCPLCGASTSVRGERLAPHARQDGLVEIARRWREWDSARRVERLRMAAAEAAFPEL
jgi:hypothetical protein